MASSNSRQKQPGKASTGAPDIQGFRLIFSNVDVDGGQKVKTFHQKPGNLGALLNLWQDNFEEVADICSQRGFDQKKLSPEDGSLTLTGFDGGRRVPIRNTEALSSFFLQLQNTKFPSVEIQLGTDATMAAVKSATEEAKPGGVKRSRPSPDRVEQLEDENFKLLRANEKVERLLHELDRNRIQDKEDLTRGMTHLKNEQSNIHNDAVKQLKLEIKKNSLDIQSLFDDTKKLDKTIKENEKAHAKRHDGLMSNIDELTAQMRQNHEEVETALSELRAADDALREKDEDQAEQLADQLDQIKKLGQVKLDITTWREAHLELDNRLDTQMKQGDKTLNEMIQALTVETKASFEATQKEARTNLDEEVAKLVSVDKKMREDFDTDIARINVQLSKLDGGIEEEIRKFKVTLEEMRVAVFEKLEKDISSIHGEITKGDDKNSKEAESMNKEIDTRLSKRVDELTKMSENSFKAMADRLEELVRAERSRMGNIEKDVSETTARLRSDFRAEVERVRTDYEQEAARLDGDLNDLHQKHDVIKQEINFFQARLLEQREWAQRQFVETATATRAAQLDAQEGVGATTKMLHALRDDQVEFRDRMAKHISLLQHTCDTHSDAVNTLETQRSRIRLDLDALGEDHRDYVGDMDGWADDVRVKVERLFRALEPPKVEWRIARAMHFATQLKRPLPLTSPRFTVMGLREVAFEFYPNGHTNSPEGKAVLRILMPADAKVRYQCWMGILSEGPREYEPGGSLAVDFIFDSWKEQVRDGCLTIQLEVLADHKISDESLARVVRIETP